MTDHLDNVVPFPNMALESFKFVTDPMREAYIACGYAAEHVDQAVTALMPIYAWAREGVRFDAPDDATAILMANSWFTAAFRFLLGEIARRDLELLRNGLSVPEIPMGRERKL